MGMPLPPGMGPAPLGPPAPSRSQFNPIAPTPSVAPRMPVARPADDLRQPGTAFRSHELRMDLPTREPYVPPFWAQGINVASADWQAAQQGGGSTARVGFQRPGPPERFNLNLFGEDPVGSFLGGDAGVALGIKPGDQRGGVTAQGIATAPVTLANFSTWGREGLLALGLSLMGKDYQQPEGAVAGQPGSQPTGPEDRDLVDHLVAGLVSAGDAVWGAFQAPLNHWRNSDAFNRGKNLREIAQRGATEGFWFERITSAMFGGSERFSMDGLRVAAARQGIDVIDMAARLYDFDPGQVAAIMENPWMTDDQLGDLTDGTPWSYDPASAILRELAAEGVMLAAGGAGLAKLAARGAKLGADSIAGAFASGVRGAQAAQGASYAARTAASAGFLTKRAMQLNNWNTAAGWTIRGAEWGIKQYAAIAGDEELMAAMDRLMWQMPLSMNPGWNLIDGFSSHPIAAVQNLRRGQVAIGRPNTPGYVGQVDIPGLALRDGATGAPMTVTLAGKRVTLAARGDETKALAALRDLSPDDMHAQFFSRLGWSRETLEQSFGEGNRYDLSWDDLRNALFYVALQAVRERKGNLGRLESFHLPDVPTRTAAFVRDNAAGAHKMLTDNFTGRSSAMLDLFRGDFWDLAAHNDTSMGALKMSLGDSWDPHLGMLDFLSWIRASKTIRTAIERGTARQSATASYRRTINREYVAHWLADIAGRYQPDEVVSLRDVNLLKKFGGLLETRGKGGALVRGRQTTYTRSQLEDIVADVIAVDDQMTRAGNALPREQEAAFRSGYDPGQDPLEDARVLGIAPATLAHVNRVLADPNLQRAPVPPRLLQTIAKQLGRTADSIAREDAPWDVVRQWMEGVMERAVDTARTRDGLDAAAQALRARVSDGRMDAQAAAPMIAGLTRIRDELLSPLDKELASRRPGLWTAWSQTAQEAVVLAEEFVRHLDDEPKLWRTVELAPGYTHLLPRTVTGDTLTAYQNLIARVLSPDHPMSLFLSTADRQRLEDLSVHPFLKADILTRMATPQDTTVLQAVETALGMPPRDLLLSMIGDAGADPMDLTGSLASMTGETLAHVGKGAELGARASQLARRFETLGGAYSDEMARTIDRITLGDRILRRGQPKGKKRSINLEPMDPDDSARRAAATSATERSRKRAAVMQADERLAAAERALRDREATPNAPIEWDPEPIKVFGGRMTSAQRRDEAARFAADHMRETGQPTHISRDPRGVYRVHTVRDAARTANDIGAPPPIPDLHPQDRLDGHLGAIAREDDFLAGRLDGLDMLVDVTRNVRTPGYAPEAMDALAAHTDARIASLEAGPQGSRETALLEVLYRRRDALAQRRVAPAPEPEGAVQTAMDMGDTEASQAANLAVEAERGGWDNPPEGQRIDLDAMRAETEAEAPAPRYRAGVRPGPEGAFPDPDTGAPVPYRIVAVEADDLITSSDPTFDPALQPRMREARAASEQQIESIRQSIRPADLLGTETGAQGMPVVLPDGQVVAGNGRVTGIRGATPQSAAAYRAAVDAEAARLGIDTAGMRNPVLAREAPLDRDTAVRLAVQLNFDTGMPPADRALGLSRLVTLEDLSTLRITDAQSLDEALRGRANDDFVQRFLGHIPQQHRGSYMAPDGGLNEDGIRLVIATTFARLVDAGSSAAGQRLLVDLFESDPEVRVLAGGLDAAGMLVAARAESLGRTYEGVIPEFAADLVPALSRVFGLRAGGGTMRDVRTSLMSAGDLFGAVDDAALTEPQRVLAIDLTMMKSAAEFRRFLRIVAGSVRHSDADQVGMFAETEMAPSYPAVVNDALRQLNMQRPEGDQFSLVPEADGTTIVRDQTGAETARLLPVIDSVPDVLAREAPDLVDVVLDGDDWGLLAEQAARSTGRIVIPVGSQAEADALGAFLRGEGEALPRDYRVVDGIIEPVGNIRGEIVERIYGRYRNEANARVGAAYLTWLLTGEGVRPPVPANVQKFVDSELAYRRGPRPVPTHPDLPALRDALAGRDFEVRVRGSEPLPEPGVTPAAPPTIISAGAERDIPADFEAVTELSPARPDLETDARAAAASGAHRLVTSSDQAREAAAQRAAGAPVHHENQVITVNNPTQAERIRAATDIRDRAAAEAEAARRDLAALGDEPAGPPMRDILQPSEAALYGRYMAQTGSVSLGMVRQPMTIGEVADALASLDLGIPPLTGTMTAAEMDTLRMALLRVVHARLDDLGVEDAPGPQRPGPGRTSYQGQGQGVRVEGEPELTTPEDLSADLAEVMRELQGRVFEDPDPLAGWEGTQYEIGMLPVKGQDGAPLAPRLQWDDFLRTLDERFPTLADELLMGRRREWGARVEDGRLHQWMSRMPGAAYVRALRRLPDTVFGARPEREIVRQAMDRFVGDLMARTPEGVDVAARAKMEGQIEGLIGYWHERMAEHTRTRLRLPEWRRIGLVTSHKLDEWAAAYFEKEGLTPEWLPAFRADAEQRGIANPFAEAWRRADNRIRARFAEMDGGVARFIEQVYDSGIARRLHEETRGLTVSYHNWRFLMDIRWLGLEVTEAPTLVAFREGPAVLLEGLGRGPDAGRRPLFVGMEASERMRTNYAWWLAQSDPGALLRTRERFILAMVRRKQEQEFPRIMRDMAAKDPSLAAAVRAWGGGDPMSWLRELDADWELAARRGKVIAGVKDRERLFRPWLERGSISKDEYDGLMKSGRYVGHPLIDAELARVADPRIGAMLQRLEAINEMAWNDSAALVFGQVDRSNIQRFLNSPLLYWPLSYQIKATKWLGGLLFDRAFGVDTGAGGATLLGLIHEEHKHRMATDEQYATRVSQDPTLLFFAQMLMPIAPWDIGVGLSPLTRAGLAVLTEDDPTEGYRRNIFAIGPGYTLFQLLPRLLYEQGKEGSWAQQGGIVEEAVDRLQRLAPYSVPVAPSRQSELTSVERQTYGGQPPAPAPFQPPADRYGGSQTSS